MKNIGLLIWGLKTGGAERVVSRLSAILSRSYNVYVIVFDAADMRYPVAGTLVDMRIGQGKTPLSKPFVLLRRIRALRAIKRRLALDFTCSFLGSANIVNLLARARDTVAVSIRNDIAAERVHGIMNRAYDLLLRLLIRRADYVVPVSRVIARELVESTRIPPERVCTIYNPYDMRELNGLMAAEPDAALAAALGGRRAVASVGRLSYQKGYWHLLRAFALVHRNAPDTVLLLIGEGEGESALRRMASALGIADCVLFLGYCANPFAVLRRASVYVLSSLYEGFPNALVEGMACGVPVVCADCKSGPREILYDEPNLAASADSIEYADNGILVPPLSPREDYAAAAPEPEEALLAQAMLAVLDDRALAQRYGAAAARRAADFSYDVCLRQFQSIIGL